MSTTEDTVAKRALLQNPETLATVIGAIVRQTYGDAALDWDPATVSLELRDDFNAELDSATMDRWCALQVILTSDAFFQRIDAFTTCCNTLASGVPFFQVFDPVTTEEAGWALTEMQLNRDMLEFSPTIKQYLRVLLKQDGYDESEYPHIFKEVLGIKHEDGAITENNSNVEAYIDDQLKDMAYQFAKIPSLKGMNEVMLARSMEEFISK